MIRNRVRQSFTVEAKSNGPRGRVTIPARAPKTPARPTRSQAEAVFEPEPPAPAGDAEPRRILQSLIAPEPAQAEPEPELRPVRAKRVARVPMAARPAVAVAAPVRPIPVAVQAPIAVAAPRVRRSERPDASLLGRGERWKRRLPQSCW